MSAVRLGVDARRAVAHAAAPTGTDRTDVLLEDRTDPSAGSSTDIDTTVRLRLERTQPRSIAMYASQHVLNEQLARHRWQELSSQAHRSRLLRAVRAERRARRAEQSAQRAAQAARNASLAARLAAEHLV